MSVSVMCRERKNAALCIKVWGPSKQRAEPSRPPPTPTDEILEPENVMSLQYLYEGPSEKVRDGYCWPLSANIFALVNEARGIFGSAIGSSSLRYALLAVSGLERRGYGESSIAYKEFEVGSTIPS
jgi:hypothetical protein